ncbi:molybdenum cofactor guanylyltransferase [Virgibacillus necropolis]|uniref:molybdenum cofactor guanylyltransferase n=1 Tax=Virgibacillus necropolis TaxID=163877 RepID=UPI003850FE65
MNRCGVILAGGHSTRMGTNKALLPLHNRTVIEHIADEMKSISDEIVINSNDASLFSYLGLPIVEDRYKDQGPLAGIEAILSQVDSDVFLISACDTPFVNQQVYLYLLEQLEGFDAVIPIHKEKMHPLSGVYCRNIVNKLQSQLDSGERKVKLLFEHIHVKYVDEFPGIPYKELEKHFFNMNNPVQYEEAKRL